jgi:hypothetical protein
MSQLAKDLAHDVTVCIAKLARASALQPKHMDDLRRIKNALVGAGKIEDVAAQAVKDVNTFLDREGLTHEMREAAFDLRSKLRSLALIAEVDAFMDAHVVVVEVSE